MGLSREELAKAAKLSVYTIVNYERGNTIPNSHNLNKLAHALDVSPAYLASAALYEPEFLKDDFGDPFSADL